MDTSERSNKVFRAKLGGRQHWVPQCTDAGTSSTEGSPNDVSFFSKRVVNAKNSLPADTNLNSVAGFKRSIAKVDFTTF